MEKFVESKFVTRSVNIGLGSLLIGLLFALIAVTTSIFLEFTDWWTAFCFIFGTGLVFGGALFGAIVGRFSKRDEYTSKFIKYIRLRLSEAYTKEELESLLREFGELAIEGGTYCLSYPVDLRRIHQEIITKIDFITELKKREENGK